MMINMINDRYKKMKNLFLRQSYIDAWQDYQRSLRKKSFAQWDYIVLTASNEEQAEAFRSQISYRQEKHVLPCRTKYLVLPDPDGKRVGSGGATLQVLRKLAEIEEISGDFHNKRIRSFILAETASAFHSTLCAESFFPRYPVSCRMEERPVCLTSS